MSRVESVAQTVADVVDGNDRQENKQPRENGRPCGVIHFGWRVLEHIAPGWRGRLHAEAQIAEARFRNNGGADSQGGGDDDGTERVWQDMAEDHAPVSDTLRFGRFDKLFLAQR